MNMAYCRFQNTLPDLRDCYDWLCEHEPTRDLSAEELRAYDELVKLCKTIADDCAQ